MDYDVVIVGAGPAGLSAAIRLKQKCAEEGKDLSVCVVEKGAQVGAHILSGNVLEPRALDELLPNWRDEESPIKVPATNDRFYLLTEKRAIRMPSPFQNHGKFVTSLSEVTRWLGSKAEELGVEIYPGFAAAEVLYSEEGAVRGIATNDMGVAKDGSRKDSFQRGMELRGRVTLFGEGCRGSLSETLMKRFGLREKAKADPQSYALGIKEVWEVDPAKHEAGSTIHTVGWPLDRHTYGGSFIYHMADNQVAIGYVVALDYKNPYLSPYQEFQRFKLHPFVRPLLEGGTCVQYGARSLNEGGYQAVPELAFPGGALIGCSAGFLNVPKIKGTHTAMKSGMLAAEAAFSALAADETAGTSGGRDVMLTSYSDALKASWVWDELYQARNIRPAFHAGLWGGLAYSGLDHYVLRGRAPWTFHWKKPDHQHLEPASRHQPIEYPKPDNEITFDLLTSLYRSSTNHDHNQPAHLRLRDPSIPATVNQPVYAGPEGRYCPARVYEYVPDEKNQPQLHINAQNCLHCKACDIKDPTQNIQWTVPEGGGGPGYSVM
ncbi:Electron transfer flavoprotein ubiquinone oxidoreductase [Klebsormidium nitens]|uniref:Electron transfer flavoprotein-ubiquinone oxidoreductase n=1 Tax=Klebsormidium nitens TaxID=105231 RepID=A0A1Y1IP08_KLENI|nr:Electron transfer flavoprotein ubiquinone oxidoreductase [Klebsormidium nitens]|eukprot:GAQ92474.1 Electron transfer flavoprotein ubiquinone oxidoreductase [Klebsormidium nitens]